jgi:hypothetical protein
MRYILIILFLIAACGKKKTPVYPQVISEQLKFEIERIEPQLLWYQGMPALDRPNNVNGDPRADVGDSVANAGQIMLYGRANLMPGIKAAIAPDGRPYRHASYIDKDLSSTFSRDQLIGVAEATVASGDTEALLKVWQYTQAHDGKMCPISNDNRCDISPLGSPSVSILVKDALGLKVTAAERAADFIIVNAEAASNPSGYRSYLVSRILFLKVFQNKLTVDYAHAAKVLSSRFPNNLWYKLLERVTHKGTPADFEAIGKDMLPCLQAWEKPGTEWAWYGYNDTKCDVVNNAGHELVFGARFLLRYYADELKPIDVGDAQ